ncbi:polysaccharide export protein EpsE [Ideonella sp. A 288]|uniref:polysaccharide export protein EpsE n=1 Tax=Ideonella sp. A 288 TaxID=1962181 RepID=UPI000B4A8597|nr:polysaccharide export protein EpsE [Ideonella sp. A 288]
MSGFAHPLLRAVLTLACVVLALAAAPARGQSAVASAPAEYRLGAGDVVRVVVYQNPDLTLETRITEAGVVSYPLLGSVRLGGQTVTAAEKLIADGLRNGNFVKQPQVTIVVVQVRGNQVSVLGQVNRPGRYPIEVADMRLSDLLATAGGIAQGGADTVVLTGVRQGQPYRLVVDLPTLFTAAGRANDVLVLNGDTVWVDRQAIVYIYGEVQRPGPMRLERDMTVMQALATGGGLTQRGTEKGIRVHRKAADGGKVQVLQPTMDDKVQDGDVVYVRESLF